MADSVLYFPAIRPPDNEWFTRVLLYWDRVGVILPAELAEDHAFLRPYTSALLKEKLLVSVAPEPSFWWGEAHDHVSAFLNLLDPDGRDPLGIREVPTTQRAWVRVHLTKIGDGLAERLQQCDLAKEPSTRAQDGSRWIDVEQRTANLLMAYLAVLVGKDKEVGMVPITDSETAISAFTTLPTQDRPIDTDLQPIRYALLRDILPGPAAGVEPARLAAFKHDHAELLTRFRIRVEKLVEDLAQVPDQRLQAKMVETVRSELNVELVEIERRMSERRWPMAVRGAIGIVIAALQVAAAAATGGTFTVAAGSLGLVASVDDAFQGRRRPDVFKDPLAFAALSRRELGS